MLLELESKSLCIFGLPDSGKSTILNYILNPWGRLAIIYDPMREFPGEPYDCYTPANASSVTEVCQFVRLVMKSRKYKILAIDETNRYCPSKPSPLPQAIADLNDFRAHYGLGTVYVARRPVQLNQDLTELAHYLILLNLPGKNDIAYLNGLADGLGDTASRLPKYHFCLVHPDRTYQVLAPVPATFKTNKGVGKTTQKTGKATGF